MPSGVYRFWYGFFEGCPNRYPDASRIRDCYKRFALGTRLFLKQLQLKRGNLVVETEIFGANDILHSFPQGGPKKPVVSVCNFIYKIHNASYPFVRPFTWGLITPFITIGSGPTSYLFLGIYILEILLPPNTQKGRFTSGSREANKHFINPGACSSYILRFRGQRWIPPGFKHWDSTFRFRTSMDWTWIKCSHYLMIAWNDPWFLFSAHQCWRWQNKLVKLTLLGNYSEWWVVF